MEMVVMPTFLDVTFTCTLPAILRKVKNNYFEVYKLN